MWITALSNNETAQSAREGLKLITAGEGSAGVLGEGCLLIAWKIGLSKGLGNVTGQKKNLTSSVYSVNSVRAVY